MKLKLPRREPERFATLIKYAFDDNISPEALQALLNEDDKSDKLRYPKLNYKQRAAMRLQRLVDSV